MYSKERGFSRPPAGESSVYRPSRTPRVSVPPNYSGHAIVDGEERPLGVLHEEPPAAEDRPDLPTPRFDGLPRVSELGGENRRASRALPAAFTAAFTAAEEEASAAEGTTDGPSHAFSAGSSAADMPAAPSSAGAGDVGQGRGTGPLRFLSGQGIGPEELLILGLILFLLRENGDCEERGDLDETVILLGLLLLLG